MNVPLPCLCVLFQPITFGLVVPNKSTKVVRARAHFKPVTESKPFLVLNIFWVRDQNSFRGFRSYPRPRTKHFSKLKYNSKFVNVPSTLALSEYQGWVTSRNSAYRFFIISSIPIVEVTVSSGSPFVKPSLLYIQLSFLFPFRKTSNDQ